MFINDIFSKKLNEGREPNFLDDDFYAYDPETKEIKDTWSHKSVGRRHSEYRAQEQGWKVVSGMRARNLGLHYPDRKIDEAGPFSYGAKKPKKGSVADLAAQKRKEQERGRQPVEPRDQRVGTAKVTKDVMETALNSRDLQGDYDAKRKVLHDLSLDPKIDQQAVQQRRIDLDREAKNKGLKEFAPSGGGGGRWYSDDQLYEIIGEDWLEAFDVSGDQGNIDLRGERARLFLAQEAEAWLTDRGYRVNVLDVRDDGDELSWYIQGPLYRGLSEGGFDIPEIPRAPQPRPQPKEKTSEDASKYMDTKPSSVTAKQADELGAMARKAFRPDLNPDYYKDDEPVRPRRSWDYTDPDVQPIVKQWMDKNLIDRKPMTYQQGIDEGFDDLDRYMKDKYSPKPKGGSGIKRGDYGQPGRRRGRPTGPTGGEGSGVPQASNFSRNYSERSAGRKLPRFSDDYDSIKRSEIDEASTREKLHRRHQELRKKSGLPDPDYYKELKASYDLPDAERYVKQKEIKKKYNVTNEDRERYLEELGRAGYEIINERRMTCPECGGAAYADRMLAEKQDACYHKVKSRYKVWPSAYASGALVRCRKKGAKNWGNKRK